MKVRVCSAGEVPSGAMAAFDVAGRRVLVANARGDYFAISDTCSHAQASLSEGRLDAGDCTVECPLHSAVFDLKTGEALEPPAEDPVAAYPLSIEGGDVYIEIDGD